MPTSCLSQPEKSLTLHNAKQQCFTTVTKKLIKKKLALRSALNRVLAEDIIAPINVPAHNNSAMDGFAVNDANLATTKQFTIIGSAYAGKPFSDSIGKNQAVAITTGAIIPTNANFVVPQEFTHREQDKLTILAYTRGNNIRKAGEDVAKASVVLKQGHLITPVDLGLLASLGYAEIKVWRKLRIAFFSTGDELCGVGTAISAGQIYDSNRYSLFGLLTNLNVDLIDLGAIKDLPQDLESAFLSAANSADVIITTGGVSVGEADYVKDILHKIGNINFWQLAIKPGRPFTFGEINNSYFFGLPGNPVATIVTFYQIVAPVIKKLMGQKYNIELLTITAKTTTGIRKSYGRREFIRAVISNNNGELTVTKLAKQGSGVLSSVANANCFIVLEEQLKSVAENDLVTVQPFYGLV